MPRFNPTPRATKMSKGFVHLNVHSEYSIRDGMLRIPDLVATAHTMGMPAVGLSDLNNVFALVKYYRQAHKQGMHPVVGAELTLVDAQSGNLSQCIALCKNNEGFHNLKKLITKSYQADRSAFKLQKK